MNTTRTSALYYCLALVSVLTHALGQPYTLLLLMAVHVALLAQSRVIDFFVLVAVINALGLVFNGAVAWYPGFEAHPLPSMFFYCYTATVIVMWYVYIHHRYQVTALTCPTGLSTMQSHFARIDQLSYFDPLTGLANRQLLTDRYEAAMARLQREDSSKAVGIIYLDLDGFKLINDQYGHGTGDGYLQTLAKRFQTTIRKQDLVARIGGDEFVFLFDSLSSEAQLERIAQHIQRSCETPCTQGKKQLATGASMGLAITTDANQTFEALLASADQAMYQAKSSGKHRACIATQRPKPALYLASEG